MYDLVSKLKYIMKTSHLAKKSSEVDLQAKIMKNEEFIFRP